MAKTAEHKKVVKVEGKITRVNILDDGDAVEILYDIEDCTESQITDCTVNQDVAKAELSFGEKFPIVRASEFSPEESSIKHELEASQQKRLKASMAELSFEEKFPIVRASELSLEDAFLKHEPTTNQQRRLKDSLIAGIKKGLKDFRCPIMDPSFDEDRDEVGWREGNLVYEAGKPPAVGKQVTLWVRKFKQFMPEKNSRMGTLREHDALLGLLIKYLVEEQGYKVPEAWEAVCDDSRKFGREDAEIEFETTGNRKVWLYYDLANTSKIVADNYWPYPCWHDGFWICGGFFNPLAAACTLYNPFASFHFSVAWLVFDV